MMRRALAKLRLARSLGLSAWAAMALAGVVRRLARGVGWDRWSELNAFFDTLLDRGGICSQRGSRVRAVQHLERLGVPMEAELRPGTSDFATWVQIAGAEEYAVVVDLLRSHGRSPVRTIVDAGANIGLASLYLAAAFPDSRILAVEPDPDNFRMLVSNVRPLGERIECIQAAYWPTEERLELDPEPFRDDREWSRTVRPAASVPGAGTPGTVPVVTPSAAEARLGGQGVDLLKMDIEGAEAEFFRDPVRRQQLLSRVGAVAVEVHAERFDPVEAVFALDEAGFFVFPGREILVGLRRTRLAEPGVRPPPAATSPA